MCEVVDLARSLCAAWERGDYSSGEWAHAEIEYVMVDGPSPGRWAGRAEMAQAWRDYLSAWEGHRIEVEEYRELDDERVLVLVHTGGGHGKASGLALGQHGGPGGAFMVHIRSGKVTRFAIYWDRERALADLGLEG